MESSEDTISRRAVLDVLKNRHRSGGRDVDGDWIDGNYDEMIFKEIVSLPSIQLSHELVN